MVTRKLDILYKRFGSSYCIVDSWVQRITSGQQLRDREELRNFADDLTNCYECLSSMGYLKEIDTQRVMVKIVERLPNYLRSRWLRFVQQHRKGCNSQQTFVDEPRHFTSRSTSPEPTIDDLMDFVGDAASEANDPVYGSLCAPKPRATAMTATDNKCYACDSMCESLFSCREFREMSVPDRFEIVCDNGLCFNCLKSDHFSLDCPSDKLCSYCGRKHATLLHRSQVGSEAQRSQGSSQRQAAVPRRDEVAEFASAQSASVRQDPYCMSNVAEISDDVLLPVLRVNVRANGKIETVNALLDTGSTASFCCVSLVSSFHLAERSADIMLTTLSGTGNHETSIVEFEVAAEGSRKWHKLQSYTQDRITAKASSFEFVSSFDHLKGLDISPCRQAAVSLLIGQDYAHLLRPLEVRVGKDRDPYAVRTPLGWVIHGSSRPKSQRVTSNFLTLERDLKAKQSKTKKFLCHGRKRNVSNLTVSDMRSAEIANMSILQRSFFSDSEEYCSLLAERSIKKGSVLYKLGVVVDENSLMRVAGCRRKVKLLDGLAQQILLPKHDASQLIIRSIHDVHSVAGQQHTQAMMRQRYWIIGGRQEIRKALRGCFSCRQWKEYLPALKERTKWVQRRRNLKPGDVVLIVEPGRHNHWPLGRVMEVFTSDDGCVRSMRVKCRAGEMVRPITKICFLESTEC